MNDSTIMCDEVIKSFDQEIKTIPTNFNEMKPTCKMQSFYILFGLLLITIAFLTPVSIYCYLIKYQAQNYCHFTTQIMK